MVYQQNINYTTSLGVWNITENENYFAHIPFQRDIAHPHKRLQHLAGRHILMVLFPGFPIELIKIAETRKPYIPEDLYHFSISHCGDYATALVSTKFQVGVDVEKITHRVEKVRHKFLSDVEQDLILDLLDSGKDEEQGLNEKLLTICWSIKEALYKWYGKGELDFKLHMHILELTISGDSGWAKCRLSRNEIIGLQVNFFIVKQHCISWVVENF